LVLLQVVQDASIRFVSTKFVFASIRNASHDPTRKRCLADRFAPRRVSPMAPAMSSRTAPISLASASDHVNSETPAPTARASGIR
jgi:hypothetical protein